MAKLSKVTPQRLRNLEYDDIRKMSDEEVKRYINDARILYKERASKFEQNSDKVYSHAYNKMKEWYRKYGETEFSDGIGPLNRRKIELARLSEFFSSKGSTLRGARAIQNETNKRIFGENARGRPKHRMSTEEQEKYWKFYDELINQNPNITSFVPSTKIQQYLGESLLNDRRISRNEKKRKNSAGTYKGGFEISPARFQEVITQLESRQNNSEDFGIDDSMSWRSHINGKHSVYIGKGSNK